jgi:serine/threonine protein kinase
MPFKEDQRKALSCDPSDYVHKYTIQATATSWLMVSHFKPIELDVEILVQQLDLEGNSRVYEYQRHLLNLRSDHIHLPEKVFNWSGELWFIFPLCIGRSLNEVLTNMYSDGLPNEQITARILLDVLEGLEIMHEANLCHRGISPQNLILEKSTGVTKLKDFTNLKSFEEDGDKAKEKLPKLPSPQQRHLQPPEQLGLFYDEKQNNEVDEQKTDIFLFAITAMHLAYGKVPPSPFAKTDNVKPTDWESPSPELYSVQPEHISPAFKDMIAPCLARSTWDRPSVQKLKKDKFFKKAATRNDIKKELCARLRVDNQQKLDDQPPSQRNDFSASTVRSQWDYSLLPRDTMSRELSTSKLDREESKDVNQSELTLDDNIEEDSVRNKAHKQMYPKSSIVTISPHVEVVVDSEEFKEGDHLQAQRGRDRGTRFVVQNVRDYGDQQESPKLTLDAHPVGERKENVNTDEKLPHNPKGTRFLVTSAEDIGSRTEVACMSGPAPLNHPIKVKSAPQKTVSKQSRFKVEEVPVQGLSPLSAVSSAVPSIPKAVKGVHSGTEAKPRIPNYKEKPPDKWAVRLFY